MSWAALLLGVLFVALKLTGVIAWSWFWGTLPFWGGLAFFLLFMFSCLGLVAFAGAK